MSGMDVFAHVCRQKADTLSNYCDNIQPHDNMTRNVSVFVKCDMIFWLFFGSYHKFELLTFKGSAATYWRYGGKYVCILLEIYFSVQQWKNF